MESSPPPELNLSPTLGAAFIGNIFAAILYGLTSMQTFIYFRSPHKDGMLFGALIAFLWLLDTFHLALVTHGIYHYVIENFANPVAILSPIWSLLVQVYVTCTVTFLVRCVFATRIWILSYKKTYLFAAIVLLSLFIVATGYGFASKGFGGTFEDLFHHTWMLYASLGGAVVADLTIALTLCYFLVRNRTGFKRTDSLVAMLMVYTVNTGLLTSICAAACFITFAVWPSDFIFMGIYFSLGKLYINAMLASLNARESLAEQHYTARDVISTLPGISRPTGTYTQSIALDQLSSQATDMTDRSPMPTYMHRRDAEMK